MTFMWISECLKIIMTQPNQDPLCRTMMSRTTMKFSFCLLFMFLLILVSSPMALARSGGDEGGNDVPEECKLEKGECNNKKAALRLKVIAIAAILVTSMIGVCLPLFSRSVPALDPERDLFIILKSFSSGIILATGFMHVLPDSFDDLSSKCLPDEPWHKFPFTGFAAMISAIVTLMVDSMATSFYNKGMNAGIKPEGCAVAFTEMGGMAGAGGGNLHVHHAHGMAAAKDDSKESQVRRYKVVAMVLEVGIVVHSVVIGLSLGAGDNTCTIKPLVAALCFHQMFEGMGLGGCILQAEYKKVKKLLMVFFFSTTTPFGIAMGIALSNVYTDNSPASLITEGLLNASSAGLLIYMALVDLLANDFMGSKLQASITLQIKSYAAVLLGAGGMSLMAKWA